MIAPTTCTEAYRVQKPVRRGSGRRVSLSQENGSEVRPALPARTRHAPRKRVFFSPRLASPCFRAGRVSAALSESVAVLDSADE